MSASHPVPAWQHHASLQTFIEGESALLDANDLRKWVKLFSADGTYHMPISAQFSDPLRHDSLMYENRTLMEVRARNFTHPASPSMERGVRSIRMLSNHRLISSEPDSCVVRCNFMATVLWVRQEVYSGTFTYDLALCADDVQIKRKRVDLLGSDKPMVALPTYL